MTSPFGQVKHAIPLFGALVDLGQAGTHPKNKSCLLGSTQNKSSSYFAAALFHFIFFLLILLVSSMHILQLEL